MGRSTRCLIALVGALGLVAVSCGGDEDTVVSAESRATLAAVVTTAALAVDCDPPAEQIGLGQPVSSQLEPTGQPYPANATYYCVAFPGGIGRVTIDLTEIIADLDLYVGSGSIESVQGVDISQGDNYEWKSNDFGTGDERVVINDPEPGVYYIEIVSYEHLSSPFVLTISD